jgi:hypothetical protein
MKKRIFRLFALHTPLVTVGSMLAGYLTYQSLDGHIFVTCIVSVFTAMIIDIAISAKKERMVMLFVHTDASEHKTHSVQLRDELCKYAKTQRFMFADVKMLEQKIDRLIDQPKPAVLHTLNTKEKKPLQPTYAEAM